MTRSWSTTDSETELQAVIRRLDRQVDRWPVGAGEAALERVLARLDAATGAEHMAGRRRVVTEHIRNARPSTKNPHEAGQASKKRRNEAADSRNAAAQQRGTARRQRQALSDIEARLKNAPPEVRRALHAQGLNADRRLEIIRQYLAGKNGYDLHATLDAHSLSDADLLAHLDTHHLVGTH